MQSKYVNLQKNIFRKEKVYDRNKEQVCKLVASLENKYVHLQSKYFHLQHKYFHLQSKYVDLENKYFQEGKSL